MTGRNDEDARAAAALARQDGLRVLVYAVSREGRSATEPQLNDAQAPKIIDFTPFAAADAGSSRVPALPFTRVPEGVQARVLSPAA